MIKNPILPGFNPDPSILRIEDDYYIATSSFEWFPGIPVYHSQDLINWRLLDYALKTKEHLDLQSLPPSRGVWAPCLSYCKDEQLFYISYSVVYNRNRWHFEIDNFLITSKSITGPWSKPVYINSNGFDPSLFHDPDTGRKWIINQERDFRPGSETRRPIIIQEYDPKLQKLIGKPERLTYGATVRGFTEGAHIYKHNGYYYLTTAEGGTGYGHCVCILRSKNITGPYESCPGNPILTSCLTDVPMNPDKSFYLYELYNPEITIQKAGHGSLVETQNGEWYMAHLCGRPVMPKQCCILGRETAIQKMEWTEDGWLKTYGDSKYPLDEVEAPELPAHPFPEEPVRDDFDSGELNLHFNTPRNPIAADWADLQSKKGVLRLLGRESLCSNHAPSIIARRLTAFNANVTTKMQFNASHYMHVAGLTCYYEPFNYYYIAKTYSEETKTNVLCVYGMINRQLADYGDEVVIVADDADVWLRAEINTDRLQFFYSLDGASFTKLGNEFDMTTLSDEASKYGEFTGTFVGMFAQDSHMRETWAEFDYFEYEEK
ncbi:MAG: glycoside hydrolase family 43 protein [Oscillospiraceae bacterium]|nr:glycoside hydrolase family 43 protein [Oscillospiraceae bacterium]